MVIQWTFFLAQWESQYPYVHHVTETLDFGWARNPGDSQEWRYCFFAPALKERSVPVPIYPNMEVSQNGVPHPSYHPWNKPSSSWGYLHFRKSQKKSNSHWGNLPKPLSVGKLGNSVPTCFIHPLPWYSIWVCSIIGFRKIPVSGWTSWKPPWPWYLNHKCWSKRPSFFILQPPFLTVKHVKPPFFHTSTSVFDGYPKKKNMGASTPQVQPPFRHGTLAPDGLGGAPPSPWSLDQRSDASACPGSKKRRSPYLCPGKSGMKIMVGMDFSIYRSSDLPSWEIWDEILGMKKKGIYDIHS